MTPTLSLRTRVLIGAVLWTIGLLVVASALMAFAVERHPGSQHAVHEALDHGVIVLIFATVCMVAGAAQVRSGLSGMTRLRSRLTALHAGSHQRLEGTYPSEVQPLVDDLNVMLDQRDEAIARALSKAADLAHGLKTPLAVLAHEAVRAGAAGQTEVAASIHQQVDRMRRQVDYHLAHARAVSGRTSGSQCNVRESADGLVRALTRLHADRGLVIDIRAEALAMVRIQRADLDEMLGNLLDNACRCARSQVVLQALNAGEAVHITVDDDGPGLEPAMRVMVLQRGVRADESESGSGLGLAIVRDLAELYGGSVTLGESPLGGLRAELRLPV